jgi:hypothetical protein
MYPVGLLIRPTPYCLFPGMVLRTAFHGGSQAPRLGPSRARHRSCPHVIDLGNEVVKEWKQPPGFFLPTVGERTIRRDRSYFCSPAGAEEGRIESPGTGLSIPFRYESWPLLSMFMIANPAPIAPSSINTAATTNRDPKATVVKSTTALAGSTIAPRTG